MPNLSIASWNINSIRARIDIVERFLKEEAPDILCLQETKVVDGLFPEGKFRQLGYNHQILHGQPMHHGVAILSKVPLHEDDRLDWQNNKEARHVGVRLPGGVRLESDVWSHKQLLKVVSHTPIEIEHLDRLQQAHDWVDIGRKFIPHPERYYSWWSYRARDWAASDRGRRLDHMWVSPELADKAVAHRVHEPCRGWSKPSDHVPIVTEFAF